MAVRKIEYTVTAEGISPQTIQRGGVQGEHQATEVVFNLHQNLITHLKECVAEGQKIIYRIDGYNGEGRVVRSTVYDLDGTSISYLLDIPLTRYGGIVKLVLIISLINGDITETEIVNCAALIRLKNQPNGMSAHGGEYSSLSTLAQVAKSSAEIAEQSASRAVEAQGKTESAKSALEGGTTWIFDGGNASGEVDTNGDGETDFDMAEVKFAIDKEMSDTSNNAVQNKVVKKYIDDADENSEKTENKTDTINADSTETQYPSAKAVYETFRKCSPLMPAITVGLSETIEIGGMEDASNMVFKIPLNSIMSTDEAGNYFEVLNDGSVKIKSTVKKVMISGQIFASEIAKVEAGYFWAAIKKNAEFNSDEGSDNISIGIASSAADFVSVTFAPIIMNVGENGDVISLWRFSDDYCKIRNGANTYLTIQALEIEI